jgi:hypothetical protein
MLMILAQRGLLVDITALIGQPSESYRAFNEHWLEDEAPRADPAEGVQVKIPENIASMYAYQVRKELLTDWRRHGHIAVGNLLFVLLRSLRTNQIHQPNQRKEYSSA